MNDIREYETTNIDRLPCDVCGRYFNKDVLQRHLGVCRKAAAKKRKVFDSSKQRYAGIEGGEGGIPTPPKPTPKRAREPKRPELTYKSNWRKKHEDFVNTIRAARGVSIALKTGAPLPPPPPASENPDYITCDYCGRRFNETAAQRHINFCREQTSRITYKPVISDDAKMRAAARNQYKPSRLKSGCQQQTLEEFHQRSFSTNSSAGGVKSLPNENYTNGRVRPRGKNSSIPMLGMKKSTSNEHFQGQVLRTGRDPQSYQDARKCVRGNMYPGSMESMHSPSSDFSRYSPAHTPSPPNSGARRGSHPRTHVGQDDLDASRGPHDSAPGRPPVGRMSNNANKFVGMSKFCHDCGTKYPVMNAKFCCECGCRRMTPQKGDGIR